MLIGSSISAEDKEDPRKAMGMKGRLPRNSDLRSPMSPGSDSPLVNVDDGLGSSGYRAVSNSDGSDEFRLDSVIAGTSSGSTWKRSRAAKEGKPAQNASPWTTLVYGIAATLALVVLIFFIAKTWVLPLMFGSLNDTYGVTITVGPALTRARVWQWSAKKSLAQSGPHTKLVWHNFVETTVECRQDAAGCFPILDEVLLAASKQIPEQFWAKTPLVWKTTDMEVSEKYLEMISEKLQVNAFFRFQREWVTEMKKHEESLYRWTSAALIMGLFSNSHREPRSADGKTTTIIFFAEDSFGIVTGRGIRSEDELSEGEHALPVGRQLYGIASHEFVRDGLHLLGLNEAFERHLKSLHLEEKSGSGPISAPCSNSGYQGTIFLPMADDGEDSLFEYTGSYSTKKGSNAAVRCRESIGHHILEGKVTLDGISIPKGEGAAIYVTVEDYKFWNVLTFEESAGLDDPNLFQHLTNQVCTHSWIQLRRRVKQSYWSDDYGKTRLSRVCFDGNYVSTVLKDLEVEPDVLTITENSFDPTGAGEGLSLEAPWDLGLLLISTQDYGSGHERRRAHNGLKFIFLVAFVVSLGGVVLTVGWKQLARWLQDQDDLNAAEQWKSNSTEDENDELGIAWKGAKMEDD